MLIANDDRCYRGEDLEVFNLLKCPVWVFDIEKRCMFWANEASLEVWNAVSLKALLERDFASDMSDSAKTRLDDLLVRLKRNETVTEQWTFYPQGRGPTHTNITCSAIRVTGNRIAMLIECELLDKSDMLECTVRDIEMIRHLPFAVSQYSIDGKLVYQNPEAAKLFGTTKKSSAAADPSTATTKEEKEENEFLSLFVDQDIGKAAFKQVYDGNDFSAEVEHRTQSGPRWFSVGLRRTRDPVTSDYVILFSARDISDIIKARNETTRAAMKSEFMAVMAHEIRTPLHQIVGYLDLLELTKLSKEQLDYLKQIQSSTSLLMSIINDLLDYSKLECGQVQMEYVNFALEGLLQGSLASVKPEAERKMLALHCHLDEGIPKMLVGDPNRLRQILLNLLSNAVKFTDQGSVSMSVSCVKSNSSSSRNLQKNNGPRLRFEVTDTGIGIDPLEQEIVFEKYRQANASVARHFGGTGLGLAICKGLSELMGGVIGLRSEIGKGTTMFFEIPFTLPDNSRESADREEQKRDFLRNENGSSLRILVAEDNKINQKVMRSMLERLGHDVTIAENGQLALDELKQAIFDLVLMDVQMPVMDGIECTKQIRCADCRRVATVPVIGLTASFQNADLEYYHEVGMNACLGKPLRLEQLKKVILSQVPSALQLPAA